MKLLLNKFFLALFFVFFFYSCKSLNYFVYAVSISRPKNLMKADQIRYLKKMRIDFDTANLFSLIPTYADSLKDSTYCLDTYNFRNRSYSIPQIRIYEKSGRFITGWQSCFGMPKQINPFLQDTSSNKNNINELLNRSLTFQRDSKLFIKDINICIDNYDKIIVIYWAKYLGKYNKDFLREIEKFKKNNKQRKFLYLYANLDYIQK